MHDFYMLFILGYPNATPIMARDSKSLPMPELPPRCQLSSSSLDLNGSFAIFKLYYCRLMSSYCHYN